MARPRWLRIGLLLVWGISLAAALAAFLFDRGAAQHQLATLLAASGWAAGAIYLLLGSLRAFTLIPAAYLVLAGLVVLNPGPLWLLTLAGIAVSSTSIYFFSGAMELGEYFEVHHPEKLARLRRAIERHELTVIIGWSFFPLAPTDLISYVCGALRVNYTRFLVGILVGEGAVCALYIWGAHWLLGRLI